MFGYVTIYEPELKIKDYRKYKAYYCGLCRTLKERHGHIGQLTLTYDMTFLVILLTSLYETQTQSSRCRCKAHPVKKQDVLRNKITEYAADMNLLMAYYHMKDDWEDERKAGGLAGSLILRRKAEKIEKRYPRQARTVKKELEEIARCEKEETMDLDRISGCFGRLMAELLVFREDHWQETLSKMGFFLGKFIYIMDAVEDLEKDLEKGLYNPLKEIRKREDHEEYLKEVLCMMIAECSAQFEKLPCLLDADILRNILYAGVWKRYQKMQEERKEKEKEKGKEA